MLKQSLEKRLSALETAAEPPRPFEIDILIIAVDGTVLAIREIRDGAETTRLPTQQEQRESREAHAAKYPWTARRLADANARP